MINSIQSILGHIITITVFIGFWGMFISFFMDSKRNNNKRTKIFTKIYLGANVVGIILTCFNVIQL